jgi:succinate dehydrogenase / fumarate reductase flavoprotein subunit
VFDRTRDGKILQRNFGGHRYPRLARVGDRTGLEGRFRTTAFIKV